MAEKPPLHVSLAAVPGRLSSPMTGLYELLTAFPVVAQFCEGVPASAPFEVEIVGAERTALTAPSGLPIAVDRSIEEVERTDIVIVSSLVFEEDQQSRHSEFAD